MFYTVIKLLLSHLLQQWSSRNAKTWSQFLEVKANSFILFSLMRYAGPTKVYRRNILCILRMMMLSHDDMHACANVFHACRLSYKYSKHPHTRT
jgi:hypothetical protein